ASRHHTAASLMRLAPPPLTTTSPLLTESPLGPTHLSLFFFNDPAPTEIYTLSLHDALPISRHPARAGAQGNGDERHREHGGERRSEEHTSELQSLTNLVCRLLLEKKKNDEAHGLPTHTPA